jgi:hypothetical protein
VTGVTIQGALIFPGDNLGDIMAEDHTDGIFYVDPFHGVSVLFKQIENLQCITLNKAIMPTPIPIKII